MIEDRERQRDGQRGRHPDADVRDEPQRHRERAPQHRVRHADEIQTDGRANALHAVDHREHHDVAADFLGRFVECLRRDAQVLGAEQADHTIPQIRQPQQHEDDEHEDERRRTHRLHKGAEIMPSALSGVGAG